MSLMFLVFGATFAASRPKGLQRLVLASGLASKDLSIRSIQLRRAELPKEVLQLMEEYEEKQDYENPAYLEAQMVFNKTFVCRQEPPPSELLPAFKNLQDDKTVYSTMYVVELYFLLCLCVDRIIYSQSLVRPQDRPVHPCAHWLDARMDKHHEAATNHRANSCLQRRVRHVA